MESLFKAIRQGQEANQYTQDLAGRVYGLQWGIVTDDVDPSGLHRIKLRTKAKGGTEATTNWLLCGVPYYQLSVDVPPPGSTVIFSYINGDPNEGVYHGFVKNAIDIPDPVGWWIHRHRGYTIAVSPEGTMTTLTTNDQNVTTAYTLSPDGFTVTSGKTSLTVSDGSINCTGVDSFTINNKQVTTLDATDNDGDRLVTKGWS